MQNRKIVDCKWSQKYDLFGWKFELSGTSVWANWLATAFPISLIVVIFGAFSVLIALMLWALPLGFNFYEAWMVSAIIIAVIALWRVKVCNKSAKGIGTDIKL